MNNRFIVRTWCAQGSKCFDPLDIFLWKLHANRSTSFRWSHWPVAFALLATGLGCGAPAQANCILKAPPLKSEVLDRYEKSLKLILQDYPTGGHALTNLVSQLTARKVENVALIFNISAEAKADQQVSIAIGLYRTESGCQSQDSNISKAIDTAITNSAQDSLIRAYNLALGDTVSTSTTAIPTSQQVAPQQLPHDVTSVPGTSDPFSPLPDPFGPPAQWQ